MKKKVVSLLLTSVLLATSLVACGESTEGTSQADDSSAGSDVEGEVNGEEEIKDVTLSMLYCDGASYPYREDWAVWDWIKEETGVSFDLTIVPSADYVVKRQAIFSGGDIPDIVTQTFPTASDVSSGLLLPVSQYIDQLPNLQAYLEENGLTQYMENTRYADGNYYALPCLANEYPFQEQVWLVRTDIFEKHEIPIPTTMDEMLEAGIKLKELYPESTPITNRFGANNIMSVIAGSYGTIAGWTLGDGMMYNHETGVWDFAPTTDEYKEMLIFTNALYENGVLDEEFSTLDSTVYEQRIVQGETFIMADWSTNIVRYNLQGTEIDPNYNVEPIYPPVGPDGDSLGWKSPWGQAYVLPASLADDEEHLAEVLAYLDWTYSDEAEILLTFGKEGETYEIDEDGVYRYIDPTINYQVDYGINSNMLTVRQHMDSLLGVFEPHVVEVFDQMAEDKLLKMPNPSAPLDPDTLEEVQIYGTNLKDYVNQSMEKFIFGSLTIEDDWDTYVAECVKLGADDLQAEYDEAMKQ